MKRVIPFWVLALTFTVVASHPFIEEYSESGVYPTRSHSGIRNVAYEFDEGHFKHRRPIKDINVQIEEPIATHVKVKPRLVHDDNNWHDHDLVHYEKISDTVPFTHYRRPHHETIVREEEIYEPFEPITRRPRRDLVEPSLHYHHNNYDDWRVPRAYDYPVPRPHIVDRYDDPLSYLQYPRLSERVAPNPIASLHNLLRDYENARTLPDYTYRDVVVNDRPFHNAHHHIVNDHQSFNIEQFLRNILHIPEVDTSPIYHRPRVAPVPTIEQIFLDNILDSYPKYVATNPENIVIREQGYPVHYHDYDLRTSSPAPSISIAIPPSSHLSPNYVVSHPETFIVPRQTATDELATAEAVIAAAAADISTLDAATISALTAVFSSAFPRHSDHSFSGDAAVVLAAANDAAAAAALTTDAAAAVMAAATALSSTIPTSSVSVSDPFRYSHFHPKHSSFEIVEPPHTLEHVTIIDDIPSIVVDETFTSFPTNTHSSFYGSNTDATAIADIIAASVAASIEAAIPSALTSYLSPRAEHIYIDNIPHNSYSNRITPAEATALVELAAATADHSSETIFKPIGHIQANPFVPETYADTVATAVNTALLTSTPSFNRASFRHGDVSYANAVAETVLDSLFPSLSLSNTAVVAPHITIRDTPVTRYVDDKIVDASAIAAAIISALTSVVPTSSTTFVTPNRYNPIIAEDATFIDANLATIAAQRALPSLHHNVLENPFLTSIAANRYSDEAAEEAIIAAHLAHLLPYYPSNKIQTPRLFSPSIATSNLLATPDPLSFSYEHNVPVLIENPTIITPKFGRSNAGVTTVESVAALLDGTSELSNYYQNSELLALASPRWVPSISDRTEASVIAAAAAVDAVNLADVNLHKPRPLFSNFGLKSPVSIANNPETIAVAAASFADAAIDANLLLPSQYHHPELFSNSQRFGSHRPTASFANLALTNPYQYPELWIPAPLHTSSLLSSTSGRSESEAIIAAAAADTINAEAFTSSLGARLFDTHPRYSTSGLFLPVLAPSSTEAFAIAAAESASLDANLALTSHYKYPDLLAPTSFHSSSKLLPTLRRSESDAIAAAIAADTGTADIFAASIDPSLLGHHPYYSSSGVYPSVLCPQNIEAIAIADAMATDATSLGTNLGFNSRYQYPELFTSTLLHSPSRVFPSTLVRSESDAIAAAIAADTAAAESFAITADSNLYNTRPLYTSTGCYSPLSSRNAEAIAITNAITTDNLVTSADSNLAFLNRYQYPELLTTSLQFPSKLLPSTLVRSESDAIAAAISADAITDTYSGFYGTNLELTNPFQHSESLIATSLHAPSTLLPSTLVRSESDVIAAAAAADNLDTEDLFGYRPHYSSVGFNSQPSYPRNSEAVAVANAIAADTVLSSLDANLAFPSRYQYSEFLTPTSLFSDSKLLPSTLVRSESDAIAAAIIADSIASETISVSVDPSLIESRPHYTSPGFYLHADYPRNSETIAIANAIAADTVGISPDASIALSSLYQYPESSMSTSFYSSSKQLPSTIVRSESDVLAAAIAVDSIATDAFAQSVDSSLFESRPRYTSAAFYSHGSSPRNSESITIANAIAADAVASSINENFLTSRFQYPELLTPTFEPRPLYTSSGVYSPTIFPRNMDAIAIANTVTADTLTTSLDVNSALSHHYRYPELSTALYSSKLPPSTLVRSESDAVAAAIVADAIDTETFTAPVNPNLFISHPFYTSSGQYSSGLSPINSGVITISDTLAADTLLASLGTNLELNQRYANSDLHSPILHSSNSEAVVVANAVVADTLSSSLALHPHHSTFGVHSPALLSSNTEAFAVTAASPIITSLHSYQNPSIDTVILTTPTVNDIEYVNVAPVIDTNTVVRETFFEEAGIVNLAIDPYVLGVQAPVSSFVEVIYEDAAAQAVSDALELVNSAPNVTPIAIFNGEIIRDNDEIMILVNN